MTHIYLPLGGAGAGRVCNTKNGQFSLASTGKYKVRGLVRNVEKAKEALGLASADDGLEIELMQGNISDETSLSSAMKVRRRGGLLERMEGE